MIGRIIKLISDDYSVLVGNEIIICKPCGKFKYLNLKPVVGDMVKIDQKQCYMTEILARKNHLIRPPVSNIDQAIIITSVKQPDFDTNLLDKLLVIITFKQIEPIICFTKLDLLNNHELTIINEYIKQYKKIGYKVYLNIEISALKKIFKNKISVFTGQSGAGKSTLLNEICADLNIKTAPISMALNRGKHTTRHVELLKLCGGWVADTPGFSSLDFKELTKKDIKNSFIEFNKYKDQCQYQDCMHILEPICAIKKQINQNILKSRYENYLKFIK
ncbi:MAG: ribosome small subunit-dependent GTPase A [Bacilli bacterium]